MGSALRREDLIWARTRIFARRVDGALAAVRRATEIGPVGICYSAGKDSTVVLDLVRRVVPDAPAAFFDSGAELPDTMAMVSASGAEIIPSRMTMQEMARYAGWWDYAVPVDVGVHFDAKMVVIAEPAETFVVRRRLRCLAYGLRAEESGGRALHVRARGTLFQAADRTWYCMPIARWKLADVWSYIASRELPYNAAYDAMTDARIPRDAQRVATLLGERGSGWGRHALLRRFAPDVWQRLVAEFPGLARLS